MFGRGTSSPADYHPSSRRYNQRLGPSAFCFLLFLFPAPYSLLLVIDCTFLCNAFAPGESSNVDEVGKILPSLFRKEFRRDEPHVLDVLLPLWARIAGKAIAQHSRPTFFSGGLLVVSTDSATWNTQLAHMGEELRGGINKFLGCQLVGKLQFKLVSRRAAFSRSQPIPARATRPATSQPPTIDTDAVTDPQVSAALAASYAKYFSRARR